MRRFINRENCCGNSRNQLFSGSWCNSIMSNLYKYRSQSTSSILPLSRTNDSIPLCLDNQITTDGSPVPYLRLRLNLPPSHVFRNDTGRNMNILKMRLNISSRETHTIETRIYTSTCGIFYSPSRHFIRNRTNTGDSFRNINQVLKPGESIAIIISLIESDFYRLTNARVYSDVELTYDWC